MRLVWSFDWLVVPVATLIGMSGLVVGQFDSVPANTPSTFTPNSSIPSSAFSILRPINTTRTTSETNVKWSNTTGEVTPIPPPPKRTEGPVAPATGAVRKLAALPASTRPKPAQDFLEDIPARQAPDALLPIPRKSPEPSENSFSPLPAPVDDPEPNVDVAPEVIVVPKPEPKEDQTQDELLDQREKSVTPYPKPDFSTPSEKVVPLPIQRAPADFKGFDSASPGDWNLPEPRRIFPLPKVVVPAPLPERITKPQPERIAKPQAEQAPTTPQLPGTTVPSDALSKPSTDLPWQTEAFSGSSQFQPLLGSSSSISLGSPTPELRGPFVHQQPLQYGGVPQVALPKHRHVPAGLEPPQQPTSLLYAAMNPAFGSSDSLPFGERLSSKRWQFQHARQLPISKSPTPIMTEQTCLVPYQPTDFTPVPYEPQPLDPQREIETYYGKKAIDTQRPWVEWGRPFYTGGQYTPGIPVFSDVNLLTPSFLVYGDYRTGVGVHRDNGQHVRSWAHRLNLDMDLRLTSTERFHIFTGPLDHNNRFSRLDFSNNNVTFEEELDAQVETAFFEGDLGAITGSWLGDDAPFDLPFTCGLVPLLYQNGIWMEDAIAGFAFGSPWRHNKALNWSNFDVTFFAGFNQVTSPAFNNDNNAGAVYGTAWFIEAYNGYIESDYAYLDDLDGLGRSYHNAAIAYTRRYFGRISNSVRLIGNVGQSGPAINRSADGALLLFENSLISSQPSTIVPYWNFFVGSGRPQSVARAAASGGILRNTGINFETDGLTGYPTLNATGSNSYGGAVGINILSADFRKQLILEFASLDTYGDPALSAAAGPEYALGTRYQKALNNRLIWRVDLMNGWFSNAPDIYGTRTEIRWKF